MTAEHSSSSHNKTVVRKRVTAEPRSCVKVEVAFLGSPSLNSPHGLCGRKATMN